MQRETQSRTEQQVCHQGTSWNKAGAWGPRPDRGGAALASFPGVPRAGRGRCPRHYLKREGFWDSWRCGLSSAQNPAFIFTH